jgi:hypothetical protein
MIIILFGLITGNYPVKIYMYNDPDSEKMTICGTSHIPSQPPVKKGKLSIRQQQ